MEAAAASLFGSLLDQSIDGALIIDEQAIIHYANPAMAELCGWPLDVLTGSSLNLLLPEAIVGEHDAWVAHYCERGGHSSVLGHVREMTLRRKDGETIPVELKAVDLCRRDGHHYLGAFLQNIVARKAIEADRQRLVMTDPLTGLANRRAFDGEVTRLIAQLRRSGQPAAVAVLDLDHFKKVNDQYGHSAGDAVLRTVATILPAVLRGGDFVARVGGEEFGVLMPNTAHDQAMVIMERLRRSVGEAATAIAADRPVSVTVSIGVAMLDSARPFEYSWNRADEALYQAKESGRNRTIFK